MRLPNIISSINECLTILLSLIFLFVKAHLSVLADADNRFGCLPSAGRSSPAYIGNHGKSPTVLVVGASAMLISPDQP